MQNDRHAVVNGRNQGIGRGSDNSVTIQLLPFIVLPDIVEAGEGKQLAALESNAIGLLPLACLLPLVEATRRHQAAPTLEWPAKHWTRRNRFGARIDGRERHARLLRP